MERNLADDYIGMYVKDGKTELVDYEKETTVFGASEPHKDKIPVWKKDLIA